MLSVLRHLNYQSWYALAEFVDNSVQSFHANRRRIEAVDGDGTKLRIDVRLGNDADPRIIVRDNAAGISASDYPRAFRPAEIPADRTGLSEFGMGMKSAACWFAARWHVRSAALGEGIERTVNFDIASIVRDSLEEVPITTIPVAAQSHYTEIVLEDLYKLPQGRTRSKIKSHLGSIYRVFLRAGWLDLRIDGEAISYDAPPVLRATYYKTPQAQPVEWRKEIDFDFGNNLRVRGFAALRATAHTAEAGFGLFRRGRLIQGSGDEGYRPEFIFRRPNSYTYQRLFGELELEGFEVSHTKDGFRWDENEQPFLAILKEELNAAPLPLLDQAEHYRALKSREELKTGVTAAVDHTAAAVGTIGQIVETLVQATPADTPESLDKSTPIATRDVEILFRGAEWSIRIEATNDPAVGDCFEVADTDQAQRHIVVRLSLAHPFIQNWAGNTAEELEPFLRIAAGLGLAEVTASMGGVRLAGTVRRNLNELLRSPLSSL